MKYPEERYLFTIREAAHACGISRATLLRMEESGFLTPYHIDSITGYRYYDAQNIAQIGQYQLLQELGLTRNEITEFYYQNVDIADFIDNQRNRLNRLQRLLNEIEVRYTSSNNYKTSFVELSEITCYTKTEKNLSFDEGETFAYMVHQDAVKAGHQILGSEPIFALLKSNASGKYDNAHPENEITICIPIVPFDIPSKLSHELTTEPATEHLHTFPACHAFSMFGYGDYSTIPELAHRFRQEIASRNIVPLGQPRIITHVAAYVGTHISHDNYCYELVIPCEKPHA